MLIVYKAVSLFSSGDIVNFKYFKENFTQYFRKTSPIFKEISGNFQNFAQFLREFYVSFRKISGNF